MHIYTLYSVCVDDIHIIISIYEAMCLACAHFVAASNKSWRPKEQRIWRACERVSV